jgi:hypothetical protein
MNDELEKIWKETVMAESKYPGVYTLLLLLLLLVFMDSTR